MRRMMLLIAAIALIASGAFAEKLPEKQAPENAGIHYNMDRYLFEGFEVSVPPPGWTAGVTVPGYTWVQGTSGYEGLAEAHIGWTDLFVQDESLYVTYTVQPGDHLFFYTWGYPGASIYANFTVSINGNLEYDFRTDPNCPGIYIWFLVDIDLSAYVGQTVSVDFNYAGTNGADHKFDAVVFGDEAWTPPPPPDVVFCDLVEDASGVGMFYGDTCDGENLVFSLDCSGGYYQYHGFEDYYEVEVPAGGTFAATVTGSTTDVVLWLLGECVAPGGAFTCLEFVDLTYSGDPEIITYYNLSGTDKVVYLVIDSWGTDSCGTYEMLFEGYGGAIANEDLSFGQVKRIWH